MVELEPIKTGPECPMCKGHNTFLRYGTFIKEVTLWYCWDCHKPFSVKETQNETRTSR